MAPMKRFEFALIGYFELLGQGWVEPVMLEPLSNAQQEG